MLTPTQVCTGVIIMFNVKNMIGAFGSSGRF